MSNESYRKDPRYKEVLFDPKFRQLPRHKRKIKVDKRFKSLLDDDEFRISGGTNARGGANRVVGENHERFFDVEMDPCEDSEKPAAIDGDSQPDFSSSSDDEETDQVIDINPNWEDWVDLDRDVERSESISSRLAVCNMDWDKIEAQDLFMSLQSILLSKQGRILSVKVYKSDYGKRRIHQESLDGPQFDECAKCDKRMDEDEQLRRYELDRLRYFYAIVDFDSSGAAREVYEQAEVLEFESTGIRMDLRYVPEGTEFDDADLRDSCFNVSDVSHYKPKLFQTKAVRQSKVQCSWDETCRNRAEIIASSHLRGRRHGKPRTDLDFCASLVVNDEEAVMDEGDSSRPVDMPSSFSMDGSDPRGCEDSALIASFQSGIKDLCGNADVFEGRACSDSDSANDDSFLISWKAQKAVRTCVKAHNDPSQFPSGNRKPSKRRKQVEDDGFAFNLDDARFDAVFTDSGLYNLDPNNPKFTKTPAMQKLVSAVVKRRSKNFN